MFKAKNKMTELYAETMIGPNIELLCTNGNALNLPIIISKALAIDLINDE
jgi:hypothetical protein